MFEVYATVALLRLWEHNVALGLQVSTALNKRASGTERPYRGGTWLLRIGIRDTLDPNTSVFQKFPKPARPHTLFQKAKNDEN